MTLNKGRLGPDLNSCVAQKVIATSAVPRAKRPDGTRNDPMHQVLGVKVYHPVALLAVLYSSSTLTGIRNFCAKLLSLSVIEEVAEGTGLEPA